MLLKGGILLNNFGAKSHVSFQCSTRVLISFVSIGPKPLTWIIYATTVDCEQSLFSSKIRGKERKTSKRASVTVSVTWERRCRKPVVVWALGDVHVTFNIS